MSTGLLAATLMAAKAAGIPAADMEAAKTAIVEAVRDFAEGCYTGDTERVAQAFHHDLDKSGFGRRPDGTYVEGAHSYDAIIEECRTLYTERIELPKDASAAVEIFEIADQTASVKLTAAWGIDYMLLAKYEGQWLIRASIGQSHPPTAN